MFPGSQRRHCDDDITLTGLQPWDRMASIHPPTPLCWTQPSGHRKDPDGPLGIGHRESCPQKHGQEWAAPWGSGPHRCRGSAPPARICMQNPNGGLLAKINRIMTLLP